ncbi:MAG: SCP2 sterol-binding domain-containing protein [Candidatus Thorarchaeota archaeon]
MSSSQLQEFFKFFMHQVNTKDDLKKNLADWIGRYHGKILQVHTEEGDQYLVVTHEGMTLHDGVYPSPDVIYKANSGTLLGIFTGEIPFKDTMKDGSLEVIGNAHESDALANLILVAMTGAL